MDIFEKLHGGLAQYPKEGPLSKFRKDRSTFGLNAFSSCDTLGCFPMQTYFHNFTSTGRNFFSEKLFYGILLHAMR